ncbi:hypothetical protein [Nocardioides sp. NPDC127503]|uniref:hypothetical protein n=1 Tax=Nocardioides sp. NPDC127503 TaxID=3154516 RepID=UPI0033284D62
MRLALFRSSVFCAVGEHESGLLEWMVRMALPTSLRVPANLLRRQGLATADQRRRAAMLAAVYDDMSDRNLAIVLEDVLGGDRHELLREAIDAHERLADSQDVRDARMLLEGAGWQFDDE